MKTIGLLGGMSWESSTHYYQLLNQKIGASMGGLHSAQIVMISVDFQPFETLMQQEKWEEIAQQLTAAALKLEAAGADCLLLCTNTMHKVAHSITQAIQIPFLHIADAVAHNITAQQIKKVGLLGTRFTMEEDFYTERLSSKFGLEVFVPQEDERQLVDKIIFKELCLGVVNSSSRDSYLEIIGNLQAQGAEAIIAGCTEIGMLIEQNQTSLPLFDTTVTHVDYAIDFVLDRMK